MYKNSRKYAPRWESFKNVLTKYQWLAMTYGLVMQLGIFWWLMGRTCNILWVAERILCDISKT